MHIEIYMEKILTFTDKSYSTIFYYQYHKYLDTDKR